MEDELVRKRRWVSREEFLDMLGTSNQAAGFESLEIEAIRVYNSDDARQFLGAADFDVDTITSQIEGKFISAFVHARRVAKV
jgi:arsenite methyltransferase